MARRKQVAFNKLFNFAIVCGVLMALGASVFLEEKEIAWAVGFGIVAVLAVALAAVFTPYCYLFDDEGVSLCYLFLPVERYLWKDIYAIEVEHIDASGRPTVFEFFYAYVFCLSGENVGKRRFYMNGHIRKSFRTKYLLEKYWDGTITGYLFEDVKKRIHKKRAQKQAQEKRRSTEQVAATEREIRAATRETVQPFVAQAKQYGLAIKVQFCYVTRTFEELNSRPQEGYTYTAMMEIAREHETDEDRVVTVDVPLLHVRLGKAAYHGVKQADAQADMREYLTEVLGEIYQNGIDVYCGG